MSKHIGCLYVSIPNYGELFYVDYFDQETQKYVKNRKYNRICDVPDVKKFINLCKKTGVGIANEFCDTIPASFDLNQEWVETEWTMLDVEYSGAHPESWSDEEKAWFSELNRTGKLQTLVFWKAPEDKITCENCRRIIPNH
jgi:SAM-dependent MidA family methyltransferase